MSGALRILPHYTYDDYCIWEGKWELIYGIPYAMSPAPTTKHQRITAALLSEFHFALKKCKHCRVYDPVDYKVAEDTVIQPDVLVICGKPKLNFLDFAPSLVVEVLSPSTALKDRHTKYDIYESKGVKYYLIVSQDTEEVEVFQLVEGAYQLQQKGHAFPFSFSFDEDCNIDIDFGEIW
ncbi:MAG: Uma2 family endonuclease [Pedobacter sp.]|nr:Uma2 family endonuclease [Chitinophagaceae bacterium]